MKTGVQELAENLQNGDRRALAKALTLIESGAGRDRDAAEELLDLLVESSGHELRIAVTGAPGAGKSTFINELGCRYCGQGRRVAVLAVDPSSQITGGSILGDKSRMGRLAEHANAFIRPSPSKGESGGVAWRTRESIILCAAAGYDTILLETLGTGQAETAARTMADFVLLLVSPGGGDELQGIKRGIVEAADAIVVNKADGDFTAQAKSTCTDYASAHQLMASPTPGWATFVTCCSALEGTGITEIAEKIDEFRTFATESGALRERRKDQAGSWLSDAFYRELERRIFSKPEVTDGLRGYEEAVSLGRIRPGRAARELLDRLGLD